MPEIILGYLSEINLFDILKPLLAEQKTGRFVIKGKEVGEIYLEKGNIIHATTAHYTGENAFVSIMEWNTGSVTFEQEKSSRERTIIISTEQLLRHWSSRKQEWKKIREVIPSIDTFFRLSLKKTEEDIKISSDQFNVAALSNGMRTVLEVAKTLNWDEFETSKAIYHLVQAGLLEKIEGEKPLKKKLAGENFFALLENELIKLIGPVASFIIAEKLNEIGETRDAFSKNHVLSFVEALSEEIPTEEGRKMFKKVMGDSLALGK